MVLKALLFRLPLQHGMSGHVKMQRAYPGLGQDLSWLGDGKLREIPVGVRRASPRGAEGADRRSPLYSPGPAFQILTILLSIRDYRVIGVRAAEARIRMQGPCRARRTVRGRMQRT